MHDGAILTAVYILLCLTIVTYGTYELVHLSVGDQRWARLAFIATEPFALLFLLFPLKLFVFNITTPCGSWQNLGREFLKEGSDMNQTFIKMLTNHNNH